LNILPDVCHILTSAFAALAILPALVSAQEPAHENPRLLRADQPAGAWTLQWDGRPGRTYFLQQSHDLKTWTYLDAIHHDDGVKMHGVLSTGQKYFLRLRHSDIPCDDPALADFDNDGLNNADELFWLTDPFNPDSDRDEIADGDELLLGTSLLGHSSASDSDEDGLPDAIDASPGDSVVNWSAIEESVYVWLPIEDWAEETHGFPIEINDNGAVLASRALNINGSWSILAQEGADYSVDDGNGGWTQTIWSGSAEAIGMDEQGRILGSATIYDSTHGSGWSDGHAILWPTGASEPVVLGWPGNQTLQPGDLESYTPLGIGREGVIAVRDVTSSSSPSIRFFSSHTPQGDSLATLSRSDLFTPSIGFAPGISHRPASDGGFFCFSRRTENQTDATVISLYTPGTGNPPAILSELVQPAALVHATNGGRAPAMGSLPDSTAGARLALAASGDGLWLGGANPADWSRANSLLDAVRINGRGEALGRPGNLWRNGIWRPFDELLPPESVPEASLLYGLDLNNRGVILGAIVPNGVGSGQGPKGLPNHPADIGLLIPAIRTSRNLDGTAPLHDQWSAAACLAKPDVELKIEEATLVQNGLHVEVSGTVSDPITRWCAAGEARVSQVAIRWNGQEVTVLQLTGDPGDIATFEGSFTLPAGLPTSYIVRAETNANISGFTGWDEAAISVQYIENSTNFPCSLGEIRVALPVGNSGVPAGQALVWQGANQPANGDGVLIESQEMPGNYSGSIRLGEDLLPCSAKIVRPPVFGGDTVEDVFLALSVTLPGSVVREMRATCSESANDSGVFIPIGRLVGPQVLEITHVEAMESSRAGTEIEPVTVAFPSRVFGEQWTDARLVVGETEYELAKFQVGDREYLFPIDPTDESQPRRFLPSAYPVPASVAIPGETAFTEDGEEILFKLKFRNSLHAIPPMAVIQVAAPSPPPTASLQPLRCPEPGGHTILCDDEVERWKEPGDKVTYEDLYDAFAFLFGERGQVLLTAFRQGGGTVSLEDLSGDLDLDWFFIGQDRAPEIRIEEDDSEVAGLPYNPAVAANLLWNGLVQSLADRRNVFENIPMDEQVNFAEASARSLARLGGRTAISGTNLYLAGIGILSEPFDWVMVVNDLSEGHMEAVAGLLPFIPSSALKTKRLLFKNAGDEIVGTFTQSGLEAAQAFRRTDDLRVMGVKMEQHQFDDFIRKVLTSQPGPIPVPTNRNLLRERMLQLSTAPSWGVRKAGKRWPSIAEAHHDFPFNQARWFADHGIDVNNPAFGRWVSHNDHNLWHNKATPKFNEFWDEFILRENDFRIENGRPYSTQEILDELARARQIYVVTGS
jgi:hypothetical protein